MEKETIKFEEYFNKNTDEWVEAHLDSSHFKKTIEYETEDYTYYTYWYRNKKKKICDKFGQKIKRGCN